RVAVMALLGLAAIGCRSSLTFRCSDDAQCSGGRCIDGYCALTNASCASGYRYERAGAMSGQCAPPPAGMPPDMNMTACSDCDMAQATAVDMTPTGITWHIEDTSSTFRAVWGSGISNVYAVGDGGKIGHRAGNGTWDLSQSNPNYVSNIFQIWGS